MGVLVDSGRPLASAVEALEAKYGWPVGCKDPRGWYGKTDPSASFLV